MSPGLASAYLLAGLVLLLAGGEGLVRGASRLAIRLGLTPLFVGLTVVAFGTSSPELAVTVGAGLDGQGGLAIGNVVGSNIANIALILGIAALIRPIRIEAKLIRIDMPIMLGCSVLMVLLLFDGRVGRLDGALLVAGIVGYIGFSLWEVRRETEPVQAEFSAAAPPATGSLPLQIAMIVTGLVGLGLGASWFVDGAIGIATHLGVSSALIGLTIVAIGTSLPELATSVIAALRNQGDISAGNVIGSNIFNVLAILGIAALIVPLSPGLVGIDDLSVMLGVAVLLWLLNVRRKLIGRVQGVFFLAAYAAYTAYLIVGHP
jgi:cation:H+ antiporter